MQSFRASVSAIRTVIPGEIITIDGKTLGGSRDCAAERVHRRLEVRRHRTSATLSSVPRQALWKGMSMIGTVESSREIDGECHSVLRCAHSVLRLAPSVVECCRRFSEVNPAVTEIS